MKKHLFKRSNITEAVEKDHEVLTELTIESKSYWSYSDQQIKEWIPELRITPAYIQANQVFKFMVEDEIVAYYSYYSNDGNELLLDNLFVSPQFIGKGIGSILMDDFFERTKAQNTSSVIVYADPNSEAFYTKCGFEVIGQEPTSIKNRFLPILRKFL